MRLPLLMIFALSACAETSVSNAKTGASSSPPSEPSGGITLSTLDTASGYDPVLFWSLHGQATVINEALDPAQLSLELRLWTGGLTSPCSLILPISAEEPIEPAPFPDTAASLLGWWAIAHEEVVNVDPACAGWPAGTLELGIGSYDARLDPAMEARNWLDADIYGLYLRPDPAGAVYLVGVVGTMALFEGSEPTVSAAPLPDETYDLETLLVLDLP